MNKTSSEFVISKKLIKKHSNGGGGMPTMNVGKLLNNTSLRTVR
jgi:hypothetical protein